MRQRGEGVEVGVRSGCRRFHEAGMASRAGDQVSIRARMQRDISLMDVSVDLGEWTVDLN